MAITTAIKNRTRSSSLERAHRDLIQALESLAPSRIAGNADASDIKARTEYLCEVYRVANSYLDSVVEETRDHLSADKGADWFEIERALWECVNGGHYDVISALRGLGCELAVPAAA